MAATMPQNIPQQAPPQVPQQQVPQQTVVPEKKNNKILKISLFALVILLVVILSEVGYLVFSGYGRIYFSELNKPKIFSPTTQSPPEDLANSLLPKDGIYPEQARDYLGMLDHLALNKEGFVIGASADLITAGTVVSVVELNGEYEYIITVQNELGETIEHRLTKEEVRDVSVFLSISGNYQEMELDEIQSGDEIIIKFTTNFLDNSPLSDIVLLVTRE